MNIQTSYKRRLFNPKTIMDLVNLGECVIKGENGVNLYKNNKGRFVIHRDVEKNIYLETPNEEIAVEMFWRYSCGE